MKTSSTQIFLMFVCLGIILGLFLSESPIKRATDICSGSEHQPNWVTNDGSHSQESWRIENTTYNAQGLKEEFWVIYLDSFIFHQKDGRAKLTWHYGGYFQVWLEYRSFPFNQWVTPVLTNEEYQSYASEGDGFLALLGGDDQWRGVNQANYTIIFNRDDKLVQVDCPDGSTIILP